MNNRTEGAWLIQHTIKLQKVYNANAFEDIEVAGKCGLFLSGLTASDIELEASPEKVKVIAAISNIKKTEIDKIVTILKDQNLIDTTSQGGIRSIGITTSSILGHTSTIYRNNEHNDFQDAAILLSESVSEVPQYSNQLKEYISDIKKLSTQQIDDLFIQAETIGLVDSESSTKDKEKILFNGNLYRRDSIIKANSVLNSLKNEELNKINDLEGLLRSGCVTKEMAIKILGTDLIEKLQSIGFYDISEVSNDKGKMAFVTKPGAFAKFGNPFEEDALDLAKAFVASLSYGMVISDPGRGKISMLKALLEKLISGKPVGPATAIGQDYNYLELRNVVKLTHHSNRMYYMELLKKDIGAIALQVLQHGDVTEGSIMKLMNNNITSYTRPETSREITRMNQSPESREKVKNFLKTFRD